MKMTHQFNSIFFLHCSFIYLILGIIRQHTPTHCTVIYIVLVSSHREQSRLNPINCHSNKLFGTCYSCPQSAITIFLLVFPLSLPQLSIACTTFIVSGVTFPNTTCLPSNQVVFTVHKKN